MVTPQQKRTGPTGVPNVNAQRVVPFEGRAGQQASAIGEALGTAGAQTFRLTEVMQRDLDNAKFQEASARYAELLSDTEAEFNQLQGEAAHKSFDEYKRKLDTKRTELEKYLTSERQRAAFGRDSGVRQSVTLNRMNARRAEQLKVHRIAATTASLDRAMRDRVSAAVTGDTRDYIRQSMIMHRKLGDLAKLNNMPEEARKLAAETAEDAVTVAAVSGLIDIGAVDRAERFLESVDGEIQDPVQRSKLQERLKTVRVKQKAESLVDTVRQQGDFLKQRRYIRDMKGASVELKDELRRRVSQLYAEDRAEQAYARTEALAQAKEYDLRGEAYPEQLESQLKDLGVLRKAQSARSNTTTDAGRVLLNSITPEQIQSFGTPEELYQAYSHMLSHEDSQRLTARWYQFALAEMKEKANLEGSARSKRTRATASNPEQITKYQRERLIRVQLANLSPEWEAELTDGSGKLAAKAALRLERIQLAVTERLNTLEQFSVNKDPNELLKQAVMDVLSVRTAEGGRFYAGMSPREVETANLAVDVFDEARQVETVEEFNLSRIKRPGQTDADVREDLASTLKVLREEAKKEFLRAGYSEMDAVRAAAVEVSPNDAINHYGREQFAARVGAEEVSEALDRGETVSPELAAKFGPQIEERNDARLTVIADWEATLNHELLKPQHESVDRDDVAFILLWPTFRDKFGKQLHSQFSSYLDRPNDPQLRRQVIDVLFPEASAKERHHLWQMSGDVAFPGSRYGVPRDRFIGDPTRYMEGAKQDIEYSYEGR